MSDFTKAIERIAKMVADATDPIINETKKFVEDFDFDTALDTIVSRSNDLVESSKKWVDDFNKFINDIQEKIKTYDFSISYDKDNDEEPIVEVGQNSVKVIVKSKDGTSVQSVERTFPIDIDNEHVVQTYDADAKKLNFTVGISEPTLKDTPKEEEAPKEARADSEIPRRHRHANHERRHNKNDINANAERIRKAAEEIFGRHRI